MKTFLKSFFRNESGASAAEYALILAIIGVGLGAAALYLSLQIEGAVNNAGNTISAGCGDVPCGEVKEAPVAGNDQQQ